MPFAQRQHHRQRARPKLICQQLGRLVPHHIFLGTGNIRHMDDQRIKAGPPFGCVDTCDSFSVSRISTQPVNGLGWKGDQITTL